MLIESLTNISKTVSFLFIIACNSCILTLRICFLIWNAFQLTETKEFSLETETEKVEQLPLESNKTAFI